MEILNVNNKDYPQMLKNVKEAPEKLYIEGNKSLLNNFSIAIVGARKCTEYGKKYAKKFANELSKKGITIISGLAIGIDSVAHINSMSEKGKTVAVIGGGFNEIFPTENRYLYKKILENDGCIVSEYSPETRPDISKFPKRNRIISGISMGTVLIEARYRSGSLITARNTIKNNKPIFCIPNQLGVKTGYGTNMLIKNGANLVTEPKDIWQYYDDLEDYNNIRGINDKFLNNVKCNKKSNNEADIIQDKDKEEIYNLIGELPISINEIQHETNKNIATIMNQLSMLEIEEKIINVPGNKYIRRR